MNESRNPRTTRDVSSRILPGSFSRMLDVASDGEQIFARQAQLVHLVSSGVRYP
jgi:hypothetical protein